MITELILGSIFFGGVLTLAEKVFFNAVLPKKITVRPKKTHSYGIPYGWNDYGFPSGHSQLAVFVSTFLTFQTDNIYLISLIWTATFCICYQRIHTKVHSLCQVIFGSLFGFLFGFIFLLYRFNFFKTLSIF
jgi:membrane-associated phospholipid phosphatase